MQHVSHAQDWAHQTLTGLMASIEETHHAFTRVQLDRIVELFAALDAGQRTALQGVQTCFHQLHEDLIPHLMKEERILFPYICALEQHPGAAPESCFGTVANPIRMMRVEHDAVKHLLAQMRQLTGGYLAEPLGGQGIAAYYAALQALDEDLVQHIHWEDDVLFPRALALEGSAV